MASVEVSKLSEDQKSTLALSYAALLLQSAEVDFNKHNVESVIKAAGVKVNHHMIEAFAKALEGTKISDLLSCGASAGSSGPVADTKAATKGAAPAKKAGKNQKY